MPLRVVCPNLPNFHIALEESHAVSSKRSCCSDSNPRLAGCAGHRGARRRAGTRRGAGRRPWSIEILSSAPDQVSGGDALVRVGVPRRQDQDERAPAAERRGRDGRARAAGRRPRGRGRGLRPRREPARAQAEPKAQVGEGAARRRQPSARRADLLGSAAAALRLHHGARRARSADRRQPGHFGIPVAQEDASGNYPRDGRGYPTAAATIVGWSKNCAGEPARRVPVPHDGRRVRAARRVPAARCRRDIATTTTLDGADRALHRALGARHHQPLHLQRRDARADDGDRSRTQPDDSLWNGRLVFSLAGRRRDRAHAGHHQRQRHAAARRAAARLRGA